VTKQCCDLSVIWSQLNNGEFYGIPGGCTINMPLLTAIGAGGQRGSYRFIMRYLVITMMVHSACWQTAVLESGLAKEQLVMSVWCCNWILKVGLSGCDLFLPQCYAVSGCL